MTNQYNDALKQHLPERNIALREIPRLEIGVPVSASAVRAALQAGDHKTLEQLLPETSYQYIMTHLK